MAGQLRALQRTPSSQSGASERSKTTIQLLAFLVRRLIDKFLLLLILIVLYRLYYPQQDKNALSVHETICSKSTSKKSLSRSRIITREDAFINIKSNIQSSFACSGNMNYEHEWRYRSCSFKNICYDKSKQQFYFYKSPDTPRKPILFEPKHGHLYSFHFNDHGFVNLNAHASHLESWGPTVIDALIPRENVTTLTQPHFLFLHRHVSQFNPGHVIWEDIASPFSTMVRLGEYKHKQAVLMEYKNFPPADSKFRQLYNQLVPAFAAKVVSLDEYVNSFETPTVCFSNVMAGGATPVFTSNLHMYNHGQERMFYDFRSAVLRYHGVNLIQPPRTHRILLVNKTETNRESTRAIKNLAEVETFIRQTYPKIKVDVINWKGIPFRQQMHELHATTVLITPCGGVSSIVPFLPKGAHAIIMDYYVNKEAFISGTLWDVGESASMDSSIWNYFPHIRKLYYQVRGPDDFHFGFSKSNNSRDDAEIIIKMNRLKELIDTAIHNLGAEQY